VEDNFKFAEQALRWEEIQLLDLEVSAPWWH
jgi:hypothetical protein